MNDRNEKKNKSLTNDINEKKNKLLMASGNDGLNVVRKQKLAEMDTDEKVEFAQSQTVVSNPQYSHFHNR
eukprot:scaffold188160_cov81-Attheya_sp.AAC.2